MIFKTIWKEFIYGGHLQSLGTAGIVYVSGLLLKISVSWDLLFITYLIFYSLYLYNRFKEIKRDYLTNPERTAHLETYYKFIPFIFSFVLIVLVLFLIRFANSQAMAFGLILVVLGLLYTVTFKMLTKKVALFKNFYVAAFFASLAFFLIVYSNPTLTEKLIIGAVYLAVLIYLKSVIMQIFLDMKDLETDKEVGLLTLSNIFDKERTIKVLKSLTLLSGLLILLISPLWLNIFPYSILMLLLTIPFNFLCFALARKKEYSGYVLAGAEFAIWPALLIIGQALTLI